MQDQRKTKQQLIAELEALHRDLVVEKALGRMRTQAMGMQKSAEIADVRDLLFREFHGLGYPVRSASIAMRDEESDTSTIWLIRPDINYSAMTNYSGLRVDSERKNAFAARARGAAYYTHEWDKTEYDQRLRDFCDSANLDDPETLGFSFRGRTVSHRFFLTHGAIMLWGEEPLPDPDLDVAKRFVDVFDFSYIRFLELQRLETQNRDLQIEQSLERVRTRIAAMQQSDELVAVGEAIRRALTELGLTVDLLGFNLIDDAEMRTWWADEYIAAVPLQEALQTAAGRERYDLWQKGANRLVFRDRDQHRRHYEQNIAAGMSPDAAERRLKRSLDALGDAEGHWILEIPFASGTLATAKATTADDAFSDADIALIARFTEVFALGYRRYAELQAAELQTEEARRERAVEKVRAEAMAMRESDDLLKVVVEMYQAMVGLGVETIATSINFVDEEQNIVRCYGAWDNPRKQGISWTSPTFVEFNRDVMVAHWEVPISAFGEEFINNWRKKDPWYFAETKAQISATTQETIRHIGFSDTPWPLEDGVVHNVPFTHGAVGFREKGLNQGHIGIVQELADALSLGYLRFLDLQSKDQAQRQLIDDLEEELQTARQLQMSLMPTASPDIPGFDIAGRCETVNHVGGDFFQYFQRDGHLAIGLADVTGHAMEAAIPVMVFSGVLKTEMRHGLPLDQLFANLNQTMHDALPDRTFVCFTMGEVDLNKNTVHLSNSGCPYPLHYSAQTGETTELQADAYPLGVRLQSQYRTIAQPLSPGDYLVFCSDGLIEAANADEDIFGFEQTAATIRQACADGLSADALIDHLVAAVQAFAGDEPQGDDITCVVLRVAD